MVWYNITAYNIKVKLVLRNNEENVICNNKNAEGVMQMKCKKNLERAIVLGLILSTGVCGSAWAYKYNTPTDGSGTGLSITKDTIYNDNVNIHISKGAQLDGLFGGTTAAVITSNNANVIAKNRNYDFLIINDIDGSSIISRENNALYVAGGSTVYIDANNVEIKALGGLFDNTALSAKNAQNWHNGDNTINISGNKVEIVGDIDVSKGNHDSNNTNTINLTLSSKDSYWIGNERSDFGSLNLTLSNGAQWIYHNGGILYDNGGRYNSKELTNLVISGGIVNLKEDSIKDLIESEKLSNDISTTYTNNRHNYVKVVNLDGAGGIFKVDIDWLSNKGVKKETDTSDYIYITNSKEGSTQTLDFEQSKANLDKMNVGDKLYFANVGDGDTSFTTVYGDNWTYNEAGKIYDYNYGVGSENKKNNNNTYWFIGLNSKSAESNPNFSAAKGAMYAGYALGTELDTLNKRMGEARYLEENDGIWVRYRHSKTGWDDTYETNGDMFQLGFDNEVTEKDGKHYRGVAIDYTDADTNIMGISGEGEHERYAVSLYDTWLGEKGHYRDLVLRGGRINSDYDVSGAFSKGYEDIGGDYHQWFGSISAEWGRKNEMGTGWYFEPQVQAQLARVGGASYVSDSGIDVDQDGATSLIGRAGFRIGREYVKDNGKHDNFYIKADLLHEFAGDKSFSLTGNDGRYDKEYDGQETWCDVGIGADISLGKNSYFWADVERTFGADFDNTWQINGGFRWEF